MSALSATAQAPDLGPDLGPDLSSPAVAETSAPVAVQPDAGQEFVSTDFCGFTFEVPAGTIIEKGSQLVGKFPDGTFGISMSNSNQPSKQKFAYELCRRNADYMRLKNAVVEKVKFGSAKGAKAVGELEGKKVTILVLPYDNSEMTTVILATPNRNDWVNHFLQTLKK